MRMIEFIFKGQSGFDDSNYVFMTKKDTKPYLTLKVGNKYILDELDLAFVPSDYIDVLKVNDPFSSGSGEQGPVGPQGPKGDKGDPGATTWAGITDKPLTFAPVIGTTSTTAKAGDWKPTSTDITDASTVGRNVLKATDTAAARTAIGAGTGNSNLAIGTTSTTAKAGDWKPASTDISDASAVGQSVLKAADAAAARTAIGAGTSSLALGTTASTASAGNHTHSAATTSAAGFMSAADKTKLDTAVDATGAITAIKNKSQIAALTPIADTANTDVTAVAELLNALIAALKA